jgi:hypothetical protein
MTEGLFARQHKKRLKREKKKTEIIQSCEHAESFIILRQISEAIEARSP